MVGIKQPFRRRKVTLYPYTVHCTVTKISDIVVLSWDIFLNIIYSWWLHSVLCTVYISNIFVISYRDIPKHNRYLVALYVYNVQLIELLNYNNWYKPVLVFYTFLRLLFVKIIIEVQTILQIEIEMVTPPPTQCKTIIDLITSFSLVLACTAWDLFEQNWTKSTPYFLLNTKMKIL